MIITRITIVIILFFSLQSRAESILPDTISIPGGSQVTTDNLGNLYVYTPTNDIIKYNKDGAKLATTNFKVLGNISFIDAGNPFEIYVFYRDQNKIIFLDNLLNLRGECDLESIGVSQIACIGRSSDNQIWIFDMAELKLKKYSKDLKLLIESASLNNFPIGDIISPTMILDNNSSILLLNNNSILEFDLFANYSKTVLKDTINSFQYFNDKILYCKNNQIHLFNTLNFKSEILSIEMPDKFVAARLEKERLFILKYEYVILRFFSE